MFNKGNQSMKNHKMYASVRKSKAYGLVGVIGLSLLMMVSVTTVAADDTKVPESAILKTGEVTAFSSVDAKKQAELALIEELEQANKAVAQAEAELKKFELELAKVKDNQEAVVHREVNVAELVDNVFFEAENNADQVIYSGQRKEVIEVSSKEDLKNYVPNNEAVTRYMIEYLRELRALNGIDAPVPDFSEEALAFAKLRAEEMTENGVLSHDTELTVPFDSMENIQSNDDFSSLSIYSDKQLAYFYLLNYYSDYNNITPEKDNPLVWYGHRISMLSSTGTGIGLYTNTTPNDGYYYSALIFKDSKDFDKSAYGSIRDEEGDFVLTYEGRPLVFLPKVTFSYQTPNVDQSLINSVLEKIDDVRKTVASRSAVVAQLSGRLDKVKRTPVVSTVPVGSKPTEGAKKEEVIDKEETSSKTEAEPLDSSKKDSDVSVKKTEVKPEDKKVEASTGDNAPKVSPKTENGDATSTSSTAPLKQSISEKQLPKTGDLATITSVWGLFSWVMVAMGLAIRHQMKDKEEMNEK